MSHPTRARPTIYRGTQMRSRLEARVAQWFDAHGVPWVYEPMCFADQRGQYLPDFRLDDFGLAGRRKRPIYVEAKPTRDQAKTARARMQIVLSSDPHADLLMVGPGFLDICLGHDFPSDPKRRWWWDEQVAWWKENGPWGIGEGRGPYHKWEGGQWKSWRYGCGHTPVVGVFHQCRGCRQTTLLVWSERWACARCGAYFGYTAYEGATLSIPLEDDG